MTNIAVIYFSGSGHTHLMAEAVAEGASQIAGTNVEMLRITGEQIVEGRWKDGAIIEKLNQADAIVFGSPTYMGGVAAQFKAFIKVCLHRLRSQFKFSNLRRQVSPV